MTKINARSLLSILGEGNHFRYFYVMLWLLRDTAWRQKKSFTLFISLVGFSTALQVGAFILVMKYVNSLVGKRDFVLKGLNLNQYMDGLELILAIALITAGLFVLSSVAQLFARILAAKMVRMYEEGCAKRALKVFATSSVFALEEKEGIAGESAILRIVTKDARVCGRVLNELLGSAMPFVIFLITGIFVFYLDFAITLIICALALGSLGMYLKIGRLGSLNSKNIEKYARPHSQNTLGAVRRLNNTKFNFRKELLLIDKLFNRPDAKNMLDAYEQRLKLAHFSIFVGSIQMALGICVVVLYFGYRASAGWDFVGSVIQYMIALKLFYSNARHLGKTTTNLNIFFPFIERYIFFVTSYGVQENRKKESLEYPLQVSAKDALLEDSSLLSFKVGLGRYALLTDAPLQRVNLNYILKALLKGTTVKPDVVCHFTGIALNDYPMSFNSFYDSLGIPSSYSVDDFLKEFPFPTYVEDFKDLKATFETTEPSIYTLNPTERKLKFIFSTLSLIRRTNNPVFIDEGGLGLLEKDEASYLLSSLSDRVTFIVYKKLPKQLDFEEESFFAILKGEAYGGAARNFEKAKEKPALAALSRDKAKTESKLIVMDNVETLDEFE